MRKIKFSKIITALQIIAVVLLFLLGIYVLKNIFFYNSMNQSSNSQFMQEVIKNLFSIYSKSNG